MSNGLLNVWDRSERFLCLFREIFGDGASSIEKTWSEWRSRKIRFSGDGLAARKISCWGGIINRSVLKNFSLILLAIYFSTKPSDLPFIPRILLQQFILDLFLLSLWLVKAAIIHVFFMIKPKQVTIESVNELVFVLSRFSWLSKLFSFLFQDIEDFIQLFFWANHDFIVPNTLSNLLKWAIVNLPNDLFFTFNNLIWLWCNIFALGTRTVDVILNIQ